MRIATVRRHRVLLDADLAALYGVETRALLQAVRRNALRFPRDFPIRLTDQDVAALRSQFVMSKRIGRGGRSHVPYAIFVVRAFVEMRESLAQHKELHRRVDELETTLDRKLGAHDRAIAEILAAIRRLMTPPAPAPKPSIGFVR